jgi:acetyltransferase-like isoleucine patch superfamily enzyme
LRKDHRPYYIKRAYEKFQKFYTNRYLRPQFEYLGRGGMFMKPWHVELFGTPIRLGHFPTVIASPDRKVRLTIWAGRENIPGIDIGNYCLICPGVRIAAAERITIGDSCMLASGSYLTDSDWHDIYDRSVPVGKSAPITLEENVWIGDSAIVCKGVTIGKNSIIGAGSVVVSDIPENAIAVGNPARVVRELDTTSEMRTRGHWLSDPKKLARDFDVIDRAQLEGNTIFGWFRSLLFPRKGD